MHDDPDALPLELQTLWPRVRAILGEDPQGPAGVTGRTITNAVLCGLFAATGTNVGEVSEPLLTAALADLAGREPECAACAFAHLMRTGAKAWVEEAVAIDPAAAESSADAAAAGLAAAELAEVVLRFGRERGQ
jgi:hypothetical protein